MQAKWFFQQLIVGLGDFLPYNMSPIWQTPSFRMGVARRNRLIDSSFYHVCPQMGLSWSWALQTYSRLYCIYLCQNNCVQPPSDKEGQRQPHIMLWACRLYSQNGNSKQRHQAGKHSHRKRGSQKETHSQDHRLWILQEWPRQHCKVKGWNPRLYRWVAIQATISLLCLIITKVSDSKSKRRSSAACISS